MREVQCPAQTKEKGAIFRHRISLSICRHRQESFYHRCHRCENARDLVFVKPTVRS